MNIESGLSTLLIADIVDSTRLTNDLGEAPAVALWTAHERLARDLLSIHRGLEIDKSDGFLLLFDEVQDALAFAAAYHAALSTLTPSLTARVGIHSGHVLKRRNTPEDVARGAKPLEIEGVAKSVTARIMSIAGPAQTVLSAVARGLLPTQSLRDVHPIGHWRFKGLDDAAELFTAVGVASMHTPPPDGEKGWRVTLANGVWLPARETLHSLPAERDSFVGRHHTLGAIAERVRQGAKLMSVLGPGGAGKTRLAVHFGWKWLGDFSGGVWWCDLSSAASFDGIVHAVAQGLGIAATGADPASQIATAIAGRGHCLVIVDNFEQVATHAEASIGRWMSTSPHAVFLVTSRELLGIPGEETVDLEPMPLPEGATLLRERAATFGALTFQSDEQEAIAELVRLLDGLPLAIELAASRMRVLRPKAMLSKMSERFRLLSSGRGKPDRRNTLRLALTWSWDLLSESEREAMIRLSVFEGGFTLAAAEAVLACEPTSDEVWALDLVQALVDKSLVRRVDSRRFSMLRSIQDLASSFAADGTAFSRIREAAVRRHWLHFGGYGEAEAVADSCADIDNLVVGFRRALNDDSPSDAASILAGAWCALRLTGPVTTAIDLAAQLASRAAGDAFVLGSARWVEGNAKQLLGRSVEARTLLNQALASSSGHRLLHARVACSLGTLESAMGDHARAEALLRDALGAATEAGERVLECRALNSLGAQADLQGDPTRARSHYEAALQVARSASDARWEGAILGNLGQLHHNQGAADEARICYEAALGLVRTSGDLRFEGNTRCNFGLLLLQGGEQVEARKELESSLKIARKIGHLQLQTVVACNLGLACEGSGDDRGALPYFQLALDSANALGQGRARAGAAVYLGRVLLHLQRRDEARRCFQDAGDALVDGGDDKTRTLLLLARAEEYAASPDDALPLFEQAKARVIGNVDPELDGELARVGRLLFNPC